jgi:hypothetical protein
MATATNRVEYANRIRYNTLLKKKTALTFPEIIENSTSSIFKVPKRKN